MGGYLGKYTAGWEERLAEIMERRSIGKASAVVTVTENHRKMLSLSYPQHSEKIHIVRNGYLEEEFPDVIEETKEEKITITYMGTFNIHHRPDLIFQGLKKLLEHRPELEEKILFKHIGHEDKRIMEESKKSTGFDKYYSTGYLPHKEALNELMESDILILTGEHKGMDINLIPGKLYEYLRSGLPIVAVTENREIEELIDDSGIRCDFSEDSVCRAILDIIDNPDKYHKIRNYRDYSWGKLSENYSRILWSVL